MRKGFQIFAILVGLMWTNAVTAQDVVPSEPDIEATIGAQIDAFQIDDFAKAFTFASPNIQGMFGSSDRFGLMVQNGYPMVWRPGEVQYLELRDVAGALWQRVMIRDRLGGVHMLDYQMIETADGWRINGVQLLRAPDVGA